MTVLGYEVGPIACKAAFVSDFEVATEIPIDVLVTKIDEDRRTMAVGSGMHAKYMPLRFDPATGAHQIGGRYLFETLADAEAYMRFTEGLEFEPGVKFWERRIFSKIDKGTWHAVGAEDFEPLQTHYANRFERFRCDAPLRSEAMVSLWPAIRDAAQAQGLASVWLLMRPETREIGLVTAIKQSVVAGEADADAASRTLAALAAQPSLSRLLPIPGSIMFDRTSLNLSIWLPRSDRLGGEAAIFPTYPVHARPREA